MQYIYFICRVISCALYTYNILYISKHMFHVRYFLSLVVSVGVVTNISIALCVYNTVHMFTSPSSFQHRSKWTCGTKPNSLMPCKQWSATLHDIIVVVVGGVWFAFVDITECVCSITELNWTVYWLDLDCILIGPPTSSCPQQYQTQYCWALHCTAEALSPWCCSSCPS
jgi:hypothetical protein